jgi:hypothetical protein
MSHPPYRAEDEENWGTPPYRCLTNRPSSEDWHPSARQARRPDSSPAEGASPLRDSAGFVPDFAGLAGALSQAQSRGHATSGRDRRQGRSAASAGSRHGARNVRARSDIPPDQPVTAAGIGADGWPGLTEPTRAALRGISDRWQPAAPPDAARPHRSACPVIVTPTLSRARRGGSILCIDPAHRQSRRQPRPHLACASFRAPAAARRSRDCGRVPPRSGVAWSGQAAYLALPVIRAATVSRRATVVGETRRREPRGPPVLPALRSRGAAARSAATVAMIAGLRAAVVRQKWPTFYL